MSDSRDAPAGYPHSQFLCFLAGGMVNTAFGYFIRNPP
jgi:hypothetical protein